MKNIIALNLSSLSSMIGRLLFTILIIATLAPYDTPRAHTPYAQWDAYRVRHLQVLTARSDLTGDALADKWVAVLTEHLPKAKAVVSRARNMIRVASLLKTNQAKVAVLTYADAEAMSEGSGKFNEIGSIPLQVLLEDGTYVLMARSDLPENHGYLVVSTLLEYGDTFNFSVPSVDLLGIPTHPGALLAIEDH